MERRNVKTESRSLRVTSDLAVKGRVPSGGMPVIEGSDLKVGEFRISIFEFRHLDSKVSTRLWDNHSRPRTTDNGRF